MGKYWECEADRFSNGFYWELEPKPIGKKVHARPPPHVPNEGYWENDLQANTFPAKRYWESGSQCVSIGKEDYAETS